MVLGQEIDDYRTNGDVSFTSSSNWQRWNGSTWVAAGSAPNSGDNVITIRSGNTATVTSSITLDQLVVESGATLNVNAFRTLTIANGPGTDLDVNGTVNNSGTIDPSGAIAFNANSTYNHTRNGGSIPLAEWDINSNCNITDITTSNVLSFPTNSYGNLSWNCVNQTSNTYLTGFNGSVIKGDFNIISTGSTGRAFYIYAPSPRSISILGDFNLSGGILRLTADSYTTSLIIYGDFNLADGSITEIGTGEGIFIFNNTDNVQYFNRTSGVITNSINFTVTSDVTLNFGSDDYADGSGTFTIEDGATIETANPLGINGSVQTASRDLSTAANYTFNGTSPQVTGSYLPATVNNLTIDNNSGVDLTNNTIVNGTYSPLAGIFDLNGNTLTISSSGTASCAGSGTIFGSAGSSFIINSNSPTGLPAGSYQDVTVNTAGGATLCGDVTVKRILTMTSGNITTGPHLLLLTNADQNALNYTSGTVIGRLERFINATSASYLFPVGRTIQTQSLSVDFNNLTTGSLLVEFISGDPGISGLPVTEGGYTFDNVFTTGYWSALAKNSLASTNYDVELDASGFSTYTIQTYTRLLKRTETVGSWILDGTHLNAAGSTVRRTGMNGIFSSGTGTQFGIAGSGPRITSQPLSHDICDNSVSTTFNITATGIPTLTYQWYKEPSVLLSDGAKYSGTGTNIIVINNIVPGDAGDYYCIVTDGSAQTARSNSAYLTVNPLPIVTFGYNYYKEIVIDQASGSQDLSDFPVLVSLTDPDLRVVSSDGHVENINGYDIIFTDADNNKLDHQIERYVSSTGELVAWVRLPVLSASSTTTIRMLYGNPAASTDPSMGTTWKSSYKGVWHLSDNVFLDATDIDNDGTNNGTTDNSTSIIAGGRSFDGTNDRIPFTTSQFPANNHNQTLSAWARYSSVPGTTQNLLTIQNSSGSAAQMGFRNGDFVAWKWGGTILANGGDAPSANAWHFFVYTYDGTTHRLYVDGVEEGTGTESAQTLVPTAGYIGSYSGGEYFNGLIDEPRYSMSVKSPGWIATEYNNQVNPSGFISVGPENNNGALNSTGVCNTSYSLTGFPAGGTFSGPPGSISGTDFNPSVAGVGTHVITYTYTDGNGCSNSINKEILVTAIPSSPVVPPADNCISNILDFPASGTNLLWYSDAGLNNLVGWGSPFATGATTAGTYPFWVTQTVNGCESSATATSYTLSPLSVGGSVSGTKSICYGESTGNLTLSGYTGTITGWQRRLNSGAWEDITFTGETYSGIPSSAGTWDFRAVIKSGGCDEAYSSPATITVNPLPTPIITGDTEVCPGETGVVYRTGNSGNSFSWTVSGAASFSGENSYEFTVNWENSCGNGYVRVQETTAQGCSVITDDYNVDRIDNTSPVITGSILATTVEGCTAGDAPAAVTTVSALEALGLTITDACTPDASLVVTHSDASSGTCPIVVTRTYTVTDGCGNFSTYDQTINVDDNTSPVITGSILATTVEG
ncbi:MAG TPA: DUF2341 domain-containing protein, partial [Bacteroidales bacterium]|nr:DUF2341 domain-containing protein [Bacteroidales bacterium]